MFSCLSWLTGCIVYIIISLLLYVSLHGPIPREGGLFFKGVYCYESM